MSKGISLHIGINQYDRAAYRSRGMMLRLLPNCDADSLAKQQIAKRFGFMSAILINEDATYDHVIAGIKTASSYLENGDLFFLSFSGHGSRVEDRSGDERLENKDDGYDETWCLYDKMLIDDDLFDLLKSFRPGVRILVIADSCHSGTSIKDTSVPFRPGGSFPKYKTEEISATCLLMAACQDSQKAYPGLNIDFSLYTYWLLEVLKQYDFCDSYRELHRKVSAHMPVSSKPNLFSFGPKAEQFEKSKPFKI
ncbi:MAG: caspase family protein [Chitinophagaceae bacterium]|nr:caspase family protein [Chitinophagaceae bacterium]